MNIKNIMKTFACAGACAVSSMAFADFPAWFSGDANATSNATWNDPDGVEIVEGKYVLENDAESALVLTPTTELGADATMIVEVTATAVLTPSDVDDLPEITGAKAGFAVARDANDALGYYGYGYDSENSTNVWVKLDATVIPSGPDANDVYPETTFTIVLNYRDGTVSFKVGGDALNETLDIDATALTSVDAFGTGSLASIDAKYEKAVAAVGDKKYGSIAEAFENKGAGEITVVDNTGADEPANAANGMPRWEAKVLALDETDENAKVTVVPTPDSDESHITLKLANTENMDPAFAVAIKVLKNGEQQGEDCAADAVKIPLETGVYTIEPVVTLKNN